MEVKASKNEGRPASYRQPSKVGPQHPLTVPYRISVQCTLPGYACGDRNHARSKPKRCVAGTLCIGSRLFVCYFRT
eukprot:2447774-Rhodomonas_salina.1